MLTPETTNRLLEGTGTKNLALINLVVEEIDLTVRMLQSIRAYRKLFKDEEDKLQGCVLQRFMLMRKVREYVDASSEQNGMNECSQDQRLSDT